MTTYLDDPVFVLEPERVFDTERPVERAPLVVHSHAGVFTPYVRADAPVARWHVRVLLQGATEIATVRAFADALHGRHLPFWLPTYQADLRLVDYDGATMTVAVDDGPLGYLALWRRARARREVALFNRLTPSASHFTSLLAPVDNGDGTATFTLSVPSILDVESERALVSFLLFGRLADDAVRIEHLVPGELARVTFDLVELPLDVRSPGYTVGGGDVA